jgi:hypothetical protein
MRIYLHEFAYSGKRLMMYNSKPLGPAVEFGKVVEILNSIKGEGAGRSDWNREKRAGARPTSNAEEISW